MSAPPPLPPRVGSYEVRVEAPTSTATSQAFPNRLETIVMQISEAKLYTNNPHHHGARFFVTCDLKGNSESTEITAGVSLNPRWTHQFEVPVLRGENAKLEIKLFEYYSPVESILLGKVDIYTSQFAYYLGITKSFPLDPVSRSSYVPHDSLARFLLVLHSSISIRFTDTTTLLQQSLGYNDMKVPTQTSETASNSSSVPPPLPPRSIAIPPTVLIDNHVGSPMEGSSIVVSHKVTSTKPLPPLPPLQVNGAEIEVTHIKGDSLLVSANNTPMPSKPTQSLFGRITDYFASSHTPLVSDSWFHHQLNSDHNCAPQFESRYYAHETRGHAEMLARDSRLLSHYVYLYVPGLYSGRTVNGKSAEGKLTKHQERVNTMRSLGLDARIIVVPNDGTVAANARIIADAIDRAFSEAGKYIILIGYSKGGVDSAAALSLNPDLVPKIRCFVTLFSPLYGSHIATDIEDSMLRPVVYLGIKNLLEADTDAVRDLSFKRRNDWLRLHPFDERVPSLSLASAVTTAAKLSPFQVPYKYILSKYTKENDGLVACKDALYPGSAMILIPAMDHVGPRPEYPVYRNHVSFMLAVLDTAIEVTHEKWVSLCNSLQQPSGFPPRSETSSSVNDSSNERGNTPLDASPSGGSSSLAGVSSFSVPEDDFFDLNARERDLIDFTPDSHSTAPTNPFVKPQAPSEYPILGPVTLALPPDPSSPDCASLDH